MSVKNLIGASVRMAHDELMAKNAKPALYYCAHGVECFHCQKVRESEEMVALFRRCLNTLMLNGLLPEYQPLADDVNAYIAKARGDS